MRIYLQHQSGKYILVDDKENKQVVCIPKKWLLTNDHYIYRDDISEHEIVEGIDVDSRFNVRKCAVMHRCDDYNVAQELKVCLATVLGYNTNITNNDETQPCDAKKPKRTVTRKHNDYLCTSEELEVAEVEAGFAPVKFPVVNISTGTFSPIASSSTADVSSPPLPRTSTEVDKPLCDDTNKMLRTLLKSVSELSTKIDKLIFLCQRLAMGVIDRRTEEMDSDAIHFPLRTHEELRSLEAALENQKYRDHLVARLRNLMCDDTRKSTKACLQYILSPELANIYTLHGTRSKFGISKYKFYSTVQSKSTLLC
ncbi:unnamed protein product [Schistosoma margrebowiei]|uniref:DUF4806 domain-containing protein n=1 Tax=Schistosoma margrebowiei TaxID=48269 RepID=A0AA85A932_9TREM|nr:unnamed protein product [Schistosoma margrebowiei]